MSTDAEIITLSGPTMGSIWSVRFHSATPDTPALHAALVNAVGRVDDQMSTWQPGSELMRFNAAPIGDWIELPSEILEVMALGLEIGEESDGAFNIALGNMIAAWGFGGATADVAEIKSLLGRPAQPASQCLELDVLGGRARKTAPVAIDLSGIAKGYGVDRLCDVLTQFGICNALAAIDGELRALGHAPGGSGWSIAIEQPHYDARGIDTVIELSDCAIATSGDYRHFVQVGTHHLSHTMDATKGGPAQAPPASVTVLAGSCARADALATAIMVKGETDGRTWAKHMQVDVRFGAR